MFACCSLLVFVFCVFVCCISFDPREQSVYTMTYDDFISLNFTDLDNAVVLIPAI